MINKSNVDIAFDIVSASSKPIPFADLFAELCNVQEYDDAQRANKISDFYTSLLIDGRFINLGNNIWDLRSRYKSDISKIDVTEYYKEELEDQDSEELEEDLDEESKDDEELESEYEPEEIE